MSRRAADTVVAEGRITVNGQPPRAGQQLTDTDAVTLDGRTITPPVKPTTIMLNKPMGYICSRDGQGGKTIYELLPSDLHHLKPVGRLDKESSGLLLLTDDGILAQQLTHPKYQKTKVYKIALNHPLDPEHFKQINDTGVMLDDGLSQLSLDRISDGDNTNWKVTMHEGRNRQIRRTFGALGYSVPKLHRTQFGSYQLGMLALAKYSEV
jgi:23S rRNA pseudouridine2605 synthase